MGAFLLSVSTFIVKIIGAVFRIPITNMIGTSGLGYFGTAYNLYFIVYSLTTSGIAIAVSKLVAENKARGRRDNIRLIVRYAFIMFFIVGIIGSVFMYIAAPYFAKYINNPEAILCIYAITPSVFFGCIIAVFRGYYQGMSDMVPTAVSQIFEAIVKLVCGWSLCFLTVEYAYKMQREGRAFFGIILLSKEHAAEVVLPYAAAAAMFGITVSVALSAVYLFFRYRGDAALKRVRSNSSGYNPTLSIMKIAIPISLGAVIANITGTIDLATIMDSLKLLSETEAKYLLSVYGDNILLGSDIEALPNMLYGAYQVAFNFLNLIPSMTIAFGIAIIPVISKAAAEQNKTRIEQGTQSVARLVMTIAAPAAVCLAVVAKPVMFLLYPGKINEVALSGELLSILSISIVFICLSMPLASILQGLSRTDIPIKIMIVSALLKLFINDKLIKIPTLNIYGAAIGTLISFSFVFVALLISVKVTSGVQISVSSVFLKPITSAIFSGVLCYFSYNYLLEIFGNLISLLFSLVISMSFYIILLLFFRGFHKSDLKMLPRTEKIIKVLENLRLLS